MEFARLSAGNRPPAGDAAPRSSKRAMRLKFYAALVLSDTLAVLVGTAAASALRFGALDHAQGQLLAAIMLPMLWAFQLSGLIPEVLEDWRRGVGQALAALAAASTIALSVAFFLHYGPELSRQLIAASVVFSAMLVVAGRALIGRISRRAFGGAALERALIAEDCAIDAPANVVRIDAAAIGLTDDPNHPLALDRLARALDGADVVYVACAPERRVAWSMALQGSNHHVELIVPELEAVGMLGGRHFAGWPTIVVGPGRMRARDEALKRAFDLALVVPALIFLAPLLAIVAAAIRLDSKGPVLFVQKRVGRGNRLFDVYKFRSMYADLCDRDGNVSASRLDRRVTRVGRLIRATSIDELPQLFNVLRGDMSFVGPRPHALGSLAGDALFWEVDQRYHHRHACKPGLTGLAQVRGFRGATHRREDLVNRLRADLEYLNGWSLRRDVAILFATVKVIVQPDPELAAAEAVLVERESGAPLPYVAGHRRLGPVVMPLLDQPAAVARVIEAIRTRSAETFAFCNAHGFNLARRSPDLAAALARATVFNDGVGIDVASRLIHGERFPANLNGTDLTPAVLAALRTRTRLFLIGSAEGVAETAAMRLAERFPNVEVVGTHHGFLSGVDSGALADRVRDSGADLLLLGMGNPHQELWAARYGERTGAVVMCVGAFLDFTAGVVSRAPSWVRAARLEWVYRLMIEPRRMFGRYVVGGVTFAGAVTRERTAWRAEAKAVRLRAEAAPTLPEQPIPNDGKPVAAPVP